MARQVLVSLTPALEEAIDDWFHDYRCVSRSDAIRKMIAHAAAIEAPELKPGGRKALHNLDPLPVDRPVWKGNAPLHSRSLGVCWKLVPFLGTMALWTEAEILAQYWKKHPRLVTDAKLIEHGMIALGWKKTRMVEHGEAVTVYVAPMEGEQ